MPSKVDGSSGPAKRLHAWALVAMLCVAAPASGCVSKTQEDDTGRSDTAQDDGDAQDLVNVPDESQQDTAEPDITCTLDGQVVVGGACVCPAPLVAQEAEGGCGCPPATLEETLFELPGEDVRCSGFVRQVGVVSNATRSFAAMAVARQGEGLFHIALLERTSLQFWVTLLQVDTSTSPPSVTSVGEAAGVEIPTPPMSLVGSGLGITIFYVADAPQVLVTQTGSLPLRANFSSHVLEEVPMLPVEASDGTWGEIVLGSVSAWRDPTTRESTLLFYGLRGITDRETATWTVGFAHAVAADPLELTYALEPLPDAPDPIYTRPDGTLEAVVLTLHAPLPIVGGAPIFTTTGLASSFVVIPNGVGGCTSVDGCASVTGLTPMLYELEYAPGSQILAARAAPAMTASETEATLNAAFTMPGTFSSAVTVDDLGMIGARAIAAGLDIASLWVPAYVGCSSAAGLGLCDGTGQAPEVHILLPPGMTRWSRPQQAITPLSTQTLADPVFGDIAALDSAALGRGGRLDTIAALELDTLGRFLDIVDLANGGMVTLARVPLGSHGVATMHSVGNLVLVRADDQVSLFQVGLRTP